MDQLLTVEQAAAYLNVIPHTVRGVAGVGLTAADRCLPSARN